MAEEGRDRNTNGQFVGRITLDDVIAIFDEREDRARPLTANDVMDALDCSRRTAHDKLEALVEDGVLETRKIGSRGRVWWMPMTGPGLERTDHGADSSADRPSLVKQRVQEMELPGSGPRLLDRQEAILAAYDYLRRHPSAKKSDFLDEVYPDHQAGFSSAEGWWNVIQPALKELPQVDPPEERGHIWHFLGG
jgi:hypothetical protein